METPLYKTINHANQTKDRRHIPTLGPYALLLNDTISHPPKTNLEAQKDVLRNQKPKEVNSEGKPLLLKICYRIGTKDEPKDAFLKVFEGDDPHELAVKFCEQHKPHR